MLLEIPLPLTIRCNIKYNVTIDFRLRCLLQLQSVWRIYFVVSIITSLFLTPDFTSPRGVVKIGECIWDTEKPADKFNAGSFTAEDIVVRYENTSSIFIGRFVNLSARDPRQSHTLPHWRYLNKLNNVSIRSLPLRCYVPTAALNNPYLC
jgi:hypothetical protein